MTRKEYLKQNREKQMMILQLKQELSEMKKSYINEHKQVKDELPVKIHYIHYIHYEKDYYTVEDDAYIKRFDLTDYYYEYNDSFHKSDGIVCPILIKAKKDGSMSKFELHYPKYGTFKFWVIGKEDEVYEIDFGR